MTKLEYINLIPLKDIVIFNNKERKVLSKDNEGLLTIELESYGDIVYTITISYNLAELKK